jgi:LacI family transcriptional regulator
VFRPIKKDINVQKHKPILLLLDVKHPYDRKMLESITLAAESKPFFHSCEVMELAEARCCEMHRFAGVIGDFAKPSIAEFCRQLTLPLVALSGARLALSANEGLSRVCLDNNSVVELMVQAFLAQGIRKLAFYSGFADSSAAWLQERQRAFEQLLHSYQLEEVVLDPQHLSASTTPIGVVAASDTQARQFSNLCYEQDLRIPQDYSLIGVDADPTESALSKITLCSVELPIAAMAEQALALLQAQIQHQPVLGKEVLIKAKQLVIGDSVGGATLYDPLITKALWFLNNHFHRRIRVEQVVDYCAVSRKTLETRFKKILGKTVHQQLHQLRMEFVKQQLRLTQVPVSRIAEAAGFSNQHYLYHLFRREMAMTPQQYREKFKELY